MLNGTFEDRRKGRCRVKFLAQHLSSIDFLWKHWYRCSLPIRLAPSNTYQQWTPCQPLGRFASAIQMMTFADCYHGFWNTRSNVVEVVCRLRAFPERIVVEGNLLRIFPPSCTQSLACWDPNTSWARPWPEGCINCRFVKYGQIMRDEKNSN